MMSSLNRWVPAFFLALALGGCEQDSTSQAESAENASATEQTELSGFVVSGVASKGPISGASISVFQMDASGAKTGPALATTTTDSSGGWSVSLGTSAPNQPLLVESAGGSYIDEADPSPTNKRSITLQASDIFEGVLFPGFTTAPITLLTDALLEKSRVEAGTLPIQTILTNNRKIATGALGFDPFTIAPTNPVAPASSASVDSIEYAMFLGGLATSLNSASISLGRAVPDYAIMTGLIRDLSDGRLNGRDANGVITVQIGQNTRNFPSNLNLNAAITRFRNNNYSAYSVTPVANSVATVNETQLEVPGTNTTPVAADDVAATSQSAAVTTNVLANDIDADGHSLTVVNFSQGSKGSVSQSANGFLVYTPAAGQLGTDSYTYEIGDGFGGRDTATVNVNIIQVNVGTPVENTAPIAVAGLGQTVTEFSTVNLSGIARDTEDGNAVSSQWSVSSGPAVTFSNANSPTTSFVAPDVSSTSSIVLTLTVTDSEGLSNADSLTVAVLPVNESPSVDAGSDVTADEQTAVNLVATATDTDGSISNIQWTQVGGTSVSLTDANTLTPSFTAPEVLIGNLDVLVFQLTATDNSSAVDTDFVSVIVNPVLIAPTANAGNDSSADEDTTVQLDGSASSDDRAIVSYSWAQTGGSGTVLFSDSALVNPVLTFPDVSNNTDFTLTLTVTDDEGGTATDDVIITALSLNQPPNTVADSGYSVDEEQTLSLTDLLANDSDPESDSFSLNSVSQGANGSVVLVDGNTVSYTGNANFFGDDSFTYTVIDAAGAISAPTTVSLTVNNVNDEPVANDDSGQTVQGIPVTFTTLRDNDSDLDGDTLSISGAAAAANGEVVNNLDGTVTYTPDISFNGSDSFTYSIVDGNGGSATASVNVTVIADSDGDGITDTDEAIAGTDPNLADSDGDGFYDQHEAVEGTNPLDNSDMPVMTEVNSTVGNSVIATDTTWTLADAPYYVTTDMSIQSGATLTIEAGVVVKFSPGVDLFVNSGGQLVTVGNIPEPQQVLFTSYRDDTVNGDSDALVATPAAGDWGGVDYQSGSSGSLLNTFVRYAGDGIAIGSVSMNLSRVSVADVSSRGFEIYQNQNVTNTINMDRIRVFDHDGNGAATVDAGIYLEVYSGTMVFNLNQYDGQDIGNATNDRGLRLYATYGNLQATVDDVTLQNVTGPGILVDTYNGVNNTALSNFSVTNAAQQSLIGRVNNLGSVTLSIDGTNSIDAAASTQAALYFEDADVDFLETSSTTASNAGYGIYLDATNGNFRNITLDAMSLAGVGMTNASTPAVFSNINLTNAPTPFELRGQNLSATVLAGLSYDNSVATRFIRINGAFNDDMTLNADPLSSGDSVWYVSDHITVNSGATLTVTEAAVIKFELDKYLLINGALDVTNSGGNRALFTSIRDDADVLGNADANDSNGDGGATLPAASDWRQISLGDNASVNVDGAVLRWSDYGFYHNGTVPAVFDLNNVRISDTYYQSLYLRPDAGSTYQFNNLDLLGSPYFDAIYYYGYGAFTSTFNWSNINIDGYGNGTDDHGIEIDQNDATAITGTVSNVTLSNITGSGFYLHHDPTATGTFDVVFSGITVNPSIGSNGIQLIGNTNTTPTFDNSVAANNVSAGNYGLTLQGVSGSFSHLNLANSTRAAVYIGPNATVVSNPTSWDDASIVFNGVPTPWHIRTDFPASVAVLGTADVGYDAVNSSFTNNYVRIDSTLTDTTLSADPLNTGDSVWYVSSSMIVPSGVTLTLEEGAVLKMEMNTIIDLQGGALVVNNSGGARATITSIRDDSIGGDTNADGTTTVAAHGDWNDIHVRGGGSINMDGVDMRYMDYGFYSNAETPAAFSLSNASISHALYYGIYQVPYGSVTYTLNNVQVQTVELEDAIRFANYNGGTGNPGHTLTLDLDNISIDDVGNDGNDRGLEIYMTNEWLLTGRVDNISVNGTTGTGIIVRNDDTDHTTFATGLMDLVLSGVAVSNPGAVYHGMQLIGEGLGNTQISVNNSIAANTLDGGLYGMTLQGVHGSYSHITVSNQTGAGMYLDGSNNPAAWDAASIVMTNVPSPWHVNGSFPASIGTLGDNTANALGYNTASSSITGNYLRTGGSILSDDVLLSKDPLATSDSVWFVSAGITVPAGITLTVSEDAILKFNTNVGIEVSGTLNVTNAGGGPAYFTSFRDTAVGGDALTDGTAVNVSDWSYINVRSGSSITMDTAVIRYGDNGFYEYAETPVTFSLSNVSITDQYNYGLYLVPYASVTYSLNNVTLNNIQRYDAIYLHNYNGGTANAGNTITLDWDQVNIDTIGNGTDDRGVELYLTNTWALTGSIDGMSIANTVGSNMLLQNASSGLVDLVMSGLDFSNPGGSYYPLQILGLNDGNTVPVINGSFASNSFDGGRSGITFQGVDGTYSDFSTTNSSIASLYFSDGADPVISSATLDSAPGPIRLVSTGLPASLSYSAGASLYDGLLFGGTVPAAGMTLSADPLGTGTSAWVFYTDVSVPAGTTLTVPADAVVKAESGVDLNVDGVLNVTATLGNEAVFTSILDDSVLGDTNGAGASTASHNAWPGINFNAGSAGTVNNLRVKHADHCVYATNTGTVSTGLDFTNLNLDYCNTGLYFNSTSGLTDPTVNGMVITEPNTNGMYLRSTTGNTLQPVFSGTLQISDWADQSAKAIVVENVDPLLLISGFDIEHTWIGVEYTSGSTGRLHNNVLTDFTNSAIKLYSTPVSATLINNVISNSDTNQSSGSGDGNSIYCSGCSAYIYGNVMSSAYGYYGGAMDVNSGSPIIRNNLFVNNHGRSCGTALCLSNANNAEIINNSFVNNVGRASTGEPAVSIGHSSGTVIFRNNVAYGNTDLAGTGLDVRVTAAGILSNSHNLIGIESGLAADATDQIGVDPQFNAGFYSANAALIDAGSDLFSNLLTQGGSTIVSDGTADTGTVDLGYHFSAAAPTINAANSTIVATNTTPTTDEVITLIVTVRDDDGNLVTAGQDVSFVLDASDANATLNGSIGTLVTDHAKGTYSVSYTAGSLPSDGLPQTEDTLTAIINGVTLSTPITVNW